MFWIRFILIGAILFVVLLLGVEFSTINADPVTVKYLVGQGEIKVSLAMVVVCAFAAGVLVTGLIGTFVVLPLRWHVARLRQAVSTKEQEVNLLIRKAAREVR